MNVQRLGSFNSFSTMSKARLRNVRSHPIKKKKRKKNEPSQVLISLEIMRYENERKLYESKQT